MNDNKDLIYFFKELSLIKKKYPKSNEFNIFSILRKSSDEVGLHSKFIFELLNPNGNHNQGDIFLDLFLKEIDIEFNQNNSTVKKESDNIDILIQTKNQVIIIENKIYSSDHSNQLSNYFNKVKNYGYDERNIFLIYLTLYGDNPNEKGLTNLNTISYSSHIKNWLEKCIKEVALIPKIRETINQYLGLVKKLTNQSQSQGFIMEIKDFLLENKDNLKLALNIEQSIIKAKINLQLNFWRELEKQLKDAKFDFKFYHDYNKKSDNFEYAIQNYYNKNKKRYFGLRLELSDNISFFIAIDWSIYYGFAGLDNCSDASKKKIIEGMKWEDKNEEFVWKFPKNELDFDTFNTPNILNLVDKISRKKAIQEIANDVIECLNKV